MKLIMIGILISAQSLAMQLKYAPSSLFKAVKNGDQEKVATIILKKISNKDLYKTLPQDLEWQLFPYRRTALLQATIDDNRESAEWLIGAGANIFAGDLTANNPFSWAFAHQQIDMLKIFMTTRSEHQRDRIELSLLNNLRFAQRAFPPEYISELINHLVTIKMGALKYDWLCELAKASKKADRETPAGRDYIRMSSTYKQIASILMNIYRDRRRAELVALKEGVSFWNILPSELQSLTIDFLLLQETPAEHFEIIQQMPES